MSGGLFKIRAYAPHPACYNIAGRRVKRGRESNALKRVWSADGECGRRRRALPSSRALPPLLLETQEIPLGLGQLLPGLQGIPLPRPPTIPLERRLDRSPDGVDVGREETRTARAVQGGQSKGLPPIDAPQPGAGNGRQVILQAFNRESCFTERWYSSLREEINALAGDGFTALWLPPPSVSVSPQGYLPTDLYDLDANYGSRRELEELVNAAHWRRISVMADVVLNYRVATTGPEEVGARKNVGEYPMWDKHDIMAGSCYSNNDCGVPSSSHSLNAAAPHVDHSKRCVREGYIDWLKWLRRGVGFDGWRFHAALGYAGAYAGDYIDATSPSLAVGEFRDSCDYDGGVLAFNQDAHRHRLLAWCIATENRAAAFDFTTKVILQEAVAKNQRWRLKDQQGNPPGLIGLSAAHAVTFIDTHDTGSSLQHWPFPRSHLQEGYSYVLSHPGTPCVFYDDLHNADCGPIIRQLIRMRRRNKLHAKSQVVIHEAREGLYVAAIDERVLLKMGPDDWHPHEAGLTDKRWRRSVRGVNFTVWEKCSKRSRYSITFQP